MSVPAHREKMRRPYALFFLCVFFYAICVVCYALWSRMAAERQLYADIDQRLLLAARSLKYMLAPDFHDRAVSASSISGEEETQNRIAISEFAKESGFIYLYTLVEKDGAYYFSAPTVTEEELKEREHWYFYPYEDVPAEFVTAMEGDTPIFVNYSDQWGLFRSVALSQRSPGGRAYLSCADCDIGHIDGILHRESLKATLVAVCFLLFSLPFFLAYQRTMRRYTGELKAVNRELLVYQAHLEDLVEERTTDLALAKTIAEDANQAKSRFVSNVSHDIRTPLNAIIGFCEAVLASDSLEEGHHYADGILRESEQLLALVNDLLDVAKMEAGKLTLREEVVEVHGLIESVVSPINLQVLAKGLSFRVDIRAEVPAHIKGDFVRLRQILLNLASNAVKFTPSGEIKLQIEALERSSTGALLRFSVKDTGIGIPKEEQAVIFERFRQVDSSTTRRYGGTGLGTTIARQLVEWMGGRLMLESAPGAGSTFWFDLPVTLPAPEEVAALERDSGQETRLSESRAGDILVAEDYPANREVARLFLEGAGHRLIMVEDGAAAVTSAEKQHFDLILMDVQMPVLDGLHAARRIREGDGPNQATPIIALTASGEAETLSECRSAAINDMLLKPFRRNTLLAMVSKWMSGAPGPGFLAPIRAVASAPAPTPLDWKMCLAEFGDRELVVDLAERFLRHAEKQLDVIKSALHASDWTTLGRQAHSLKGGAASLEAKPLSMAAGRLERFSQRPVQQGNAEQLVSALETELARLERFIATTARDSE